MLPRRRALFRCTKLLLPASLLAASLFAGCAAKERTGEDDNVCLSNNRYFETKVWGSFMATSCGRCHLPGGAAAQQNARLLLQPASYPGFLQTNLATLNELAKDDYNGQPKLLLKPLGQLQHGGGAVLTEDSPEYKALSELVTRLRSGDPCGAEASETSQLAGVKVLDQVATFRKAAIDLGGRLPTAEEEAALSKPTDAAGIEKALDAALDALLKEKVFYDRLREIYNDVLLTDYFLTYDGRAIDSFDAGQYAGLNLYRDGDKPESKSPDRPKVNRALAREPLNLISYVVQNDRPFTEILTASYAIVNPYSALAYSVTDQVTFADPADENELHEAHVTLVDGMTVPHAGVLSTAAFLNRWKTTPTNRNRARARRSLQFFLATDVLKLAERPVDASAVTAEENPTRNSAQCTVCHQVIDPLAGSFRGYKEDGNYEDFSPERTWHDDMVPPGYGTTKMPPDSYGKGLPWMAQQMAQDPRFVIGAIYTIYTGLTGHKPLPYPTDQKVADYAGKLAAWEAQDDFFRQLGAEFQQGKFNLKIVVKGVLKSSYYRGVTIEGDIKDPATYSDIGTGRLLTPEMLDRKIKAVVGSAWHRDNQIPWLTNNFKLLYGGIDSDNSPTRLSDPNGISSSVAWRMANEVACSVTAWDFRKDKASRTLFPLVEPEQPPESGGNEVPASVASIKANLVYLHKRILGETLTPDDPEITRSYQVFHDTWREISALDKDGLKALQDNNGSCAGRVDPNSVDGKEADGIPQWQDDKLWNASFATTRAWMAVTTYLLMDWKFLYH
jgi:hypothetical protein